MPVVTMCLSTIFSDRFKTKWLFRVFKDIVYRYTVITLTHIARAEIDNRTPKTCITKFATTLIENFFFKIKQCRIKRLPGFYIMIKRKL